MAVWEAVAPVPFLLANAEKVEMGKAPLIM